MQSKKKQKTEKVREEFVLIYTDYRINCYSALN